MASGNKLSDGLLRGYERNSYRRSLRVSVACNFYGSTARLHRASRSQSQSIRNSQSPAAVRKLQQLFATLHKILLDVAQCSNALLLLRNKMAEAPGLCSALTRKFAVLNRF